jgi:hypothetical protein
MVTYENVGHKIWPPAIMNDALGKMETFIKANVH